MAPGLKPKRAPQTWASTKKASKAGSNNEGNSLPMGLEAIPPKESTQVTSKISKPPSATTSRASKKLPPTGDTINEVYSEFLAASRKKQPGKVQVQTSPTEVDGSKPTNVNVEGTCTSKFFVTFCTLVSVNPY